MRTAIKTVGIIIGIGIFTLSIVLNIHGLIMIISGYTITPLMLSLAGFVIFAGFMSYALLDLEIQIKRIKISKPSIEANLLYDILSGLYIEVKNKGETGQFMSQITVLESTDDILKWQLNSCDAYWENEQTSKVSILRGLSRRIKLASFEQHNQFGWLRLYRSTPGGMQYYDTARYAIGIPFSQDGEIAEVVLRVCISSEPDAFNGEVNKTLRIKANFEFEEEGAGKLPSYVSNN